jgi:hypothetical protein
MKTLAYPNVIGVGEIWTGLDLIIRLQTDKTNTDECFIVLWLLKERVLVATRQSVDNCIQQCEDALRTAIDQYREASTQAHDNDFDFTQSQMELENAVNTVALLNHSANGQQREQLHRMRLQIQQMQNNMILLNHDQ